MPTERAVNPHYLVRGATLPDGTRTDIVLEGRRITQLGNGLSAVGATTIDADGLIALPGLVDLHTHLREPGYEQSETVLTGSQAAARGGLAAREHGLALLVARFAEVRVQVHEARQGDQAVGVDRGRADGGEPVAELGDASAFEDDVGARAVRQGRSAHQVMRIDRALSGHL